MVQKKMFLSNMICNTYQYILMSSLMSLVFILLTSDVHAGSVGTNQEEIEMGRRIYMEGISTSGVPLKAERQGAVQLEGVAAACETCHRRSGMGSLEGNIHVMPIAGHYLFDTQENRPLALLDTREAKNVTRAHAPYSEESLAKAIREGVNVSGREMNLVMPHYAMNDSDIKALSAYLKQLSDDLSPGVEEDSLHLATIITPDVDPKKADVMVKMLEKAFEQRNATQEVHSGRMRSPLDLLPRKLRNWDLSVWELKGQPETWGGQLETYYSKMPVFAVLSGISVTTWAPISQFCEQKKLPCLLPNIPLPPSEKSYYSVYFSNGVSLEANVLAKQLRSDDKKVSKRIVQIYSDDEIGRGASKVLKDTFQESDLVVENRVLTDSDASKTKELLKGLSNNDVLVLWLKPKDLMKLTKLMGKNSPDKIYVSGILSDENYSFVTKATKPHVRVIYPYELGSNRAKNMAMMKQWLKSWQIPLVDEPFQAEVFFDALLMTELSSQMLDNLYRDYLIERAEDMLSVGSNVSAYPHLSLSRGQRLASKGAYIARISNDGKLVSESDWLVP